jgi:adenosylcobinamide-phosphate synthase
MKRAIVMLLAVALDLILGDPPNRFHPLMLMGRWLSWGRKLAPTRRRFWYGAGWTLAGAVIFAWPFLAAQRFSSLTGMSFRSAKRRESPAEVAHKHRFQGFLSPLRSVRNDITQNSHCRSEYKVTLLPLKTIVLQAFLLKPVFAYRNLRRAVIEVSRALEANELTEARRLLSWHLVSRDSSQLSEAEVAGAAIESLAENLTDSLTAPLMFYAWGGLPAAWAYRFVNTADAMWGYHTPEFEQLGKFPARLDDLLNWLPARLTGWLLVVAAGLAREDGRGAARTLLTQHHRTASPNAGWAMSAMAGTLGITLTKQDVYELVGGQAEADVSTIKRAVRVADICVGLSVTVLIIAKLMGSTVRAATHCNRFNGRLPSQSHRRRQNPLKMA